jgi:hypothetical protein
MTLLGVLLIAFSIGVYAASKLIKEENSPGILKKWTGKKSLIFGVVGVFLMLSTSMFFYANPGYQYFIVGPTGHKTAVMSEGYKFVAPFSKIQPWQKYIDVKVVSDKISEADLDEIEGKMNPIDIRFIDQVTATSYVSTRFQLPVDAKSFIDIAVKFRSMSNLVNNTLVPTVREQMINTGYMFAAQNYISGDAQSFRQTFEEQLKGGAYAVNKVEIKDTIYSNIQDTNDREVKEIKTAYLVEKVLHNGIPKRIPHEITENNILISQVIVDKVDLEGAFKKRLEAQRDESAKRQLEQQKIETAKASQSRIVAEGERDKAAERVAQEKEQVKALIAIETKLKQEETNKELAAIALETEKLKADAEKVKADAESYKNRKLVSAGLTPQEKAQFEKETAIGVAREISKLKLPEVYMSGGSNGKSNNSILQDLIGAELAKKMVAKPSGK